MSASERDRQIADAIKRVLEQIETAAVRAGRQASEITLVAVTKNHGVDDILAAYRSGLRNFGENRVQEAVNKVPQIPADVHWHFLGQLQRNKARKASEFAGLIHSVDRLALGVTLDRLGQEQGRQIPVLVEVNVGFEGSKGGVQPHQVTSLVSQLSALTHLSVQGLMTVAPQVAKPDHARPYFAGLRQLAAEISSLDLPGISMQILSMGMTSDFTAAIAEGSTLVRIGQGIFGPRRY